MIKFSLGLDNYHWGICCWNLVHLLYSLTKIEAVLTEKNNMIAIKIKLNRTIIRMFQAQEMYLPAHLLDVINNV